MIERLVRWSVTRRALVLVLTAIFVVGGVYAALHVDLDALPDTTNNQVIVLTSAPGRTPEEVEQMVTRPVELALGGLPGLVTHRSLSRYGISSVTAIFDDDVPAQLARTMVAERLGSIAGELPEGVGTPELGPLSGGLGEVYHFSLSSSSRTPAELLEIATLRVQPILKSVPGVVEVNTWGGATRTLEVRARAADLARHGLDLGELERALRDAVGSAPGASLPAGRGQALLRGSFLPTDPAELGEVVVRRQQERHVRVADVASVHAGALTRVGAATANGGGEVVYVMAQMLRDANALEVTDRIEERMSDVRAVLPPDVRLELVYDRSKLVHATLRTVGKNLLEGGLLVAVVLFVLLGSLRAGLVVALAIPLSMLGAAIGMRFFGVAGNLMSLGAIDFGLVVDGAVVMVEHVFHAAKKHGGLPAEHDARARFVAKQTSSVASPMFFSVLVILLVYAPVVSLTGVDGKLFRPMALTVIFALLTSLVLALTLVPALSSLVLRPRDIPARDPWVVRGLERVYLPLLSASVARPWLVASVAVVALVGGAALFARQGTELVPQLDEGDLVIQTTRNADISLEQAVEDAGTFERAVASVPEVRRVVSRIGSPAVATDIMGLEQADVFVELAPRDEWRKGLTREALIGEIEAVVEARAPGADPSFTQPIQMRFNELLGGSVSDVALSIYGPDLAELHRLADEARELIAAVPGAADVRVQAPDDVALVEVRPRALEAARVGLGPGEVVAATAALRQGIEVDRSYEGALVIPIVLRLEGTDSVFELARQPIATANDGVVPLGALAELQHREAPSLVNHDEGARRLVVGFNVRGRELGEVVRDARSAVETKLERPDGYRLGWGGQYETLEEAKARLAIVVPIAVVLILLALYATFRSVRAVLVVFTNVPFACVGGIAALSSRDMPLSMSAAIGFIALSGIAVLNGVVYLSRVLESERSGVDPHEAAVEAARSRVRPVMMTALVAALGFVPMMLAVGVGAEVQKPLATVVVGGLVTSTLLTLVVLPTLYPLVAKVSRRARKPREPHHAP